jgi:hypothetical protein
MAQSGIYWPNPNIVLFLRISNPVTRILAVNRQSTVLPFGVGLLVYCRGGLYHQ